MSALTLSWVEAVMALESGAVDALPTEVVTDWMLEPIVEGGESFRTEFLSRLPSDDLWSGFMQLEALRVTCSEAAWVRVLRLLAEARPDAADRLVAWFRTTIAAARAETSSPRLLHALAAVETAFDSDIDTLSIALEGMRQALQQQWMDEVMCGPTAIPWLNAVLKAGADAVAVAWEALQAEAVDFERRASELDDATLHAPADAVLEAYETLAHALDDPIRLVAAAEALERARIEWMEAVHAAHGWHCVRCNHFSQSTSCSRCGSVRPCVEESGPPSSHWAGLVA